jgi:hypothetical protein
LTTSGLIIAFILAANNFKECDLDLKIALDIFIQNFVCGDRDFIILFCSLEGSISRNSGIL